MITINWNEIDSDIVLPEHHENFSIWVDEHSPTALGDTHAFTNQEHIFDAIKRTSIKNVTVHKREGLIVDGASKIDYSRAALLTSDWWQNYSHLLLDVLPMFRFLDDLDLDVIFLPPNRVTPQFIDLLDLSIEIKYLDEEAAIGVGELTLLSPNGPPSMKPAWVIEYLREKLLTDVKAPDKDNNKKIWVSRVDTSHRQLVTNRKLYPMLLERGIEPLVASQLSVKEQIQLFSQAKLVCGVHGAGFTNVVFCPEQSGLLELFDPYWLNGAFRILCGHRKMTWRWLSGQAYSSPVDNFLRDVQIDHQQILQSIDGLLAK